MRVYVYRNLTRRCWSVKATEGPQKGRVIAHVPAIVLADASCVVSEARRLYAIKVGVRQVHAGIVGTVTEAALPAEGGEAITYHPKVCGTFQGARGSVTGASLVAFAEGVTAWGVQP